MTNDEPVPGMRSVRVRRKRLEERILQVLGACYFRLSYVEDWEWEVGVGGRGVSREGGHVYGKLGETHRGNACPRPESSARARAREYPLFPSPRKGDLPSFPSCQGVCAPKPNPKTYLFSSPFPPNGGRHTHLLCHVLDSIFEFIRQRFRQRCKKTKPNGKV
jgi:hypothetical protein